MIDVTALRRAVLKVKSGEELERNFVLFHYKSGFVSGARVDECIPGTTTTLVSYIYSGDFYHSLVGEGLQGLKFRLWSRIDKNGANVASRQLLLTIKKEVPKVVRQEYYIPANQENDDECQSSIESNSSMPGLI